MNMPCKMCKFYNPQTKFTGECRHGAPVYVPETEYHSAASAWPPMPPEGWCGKFEISSPRLAEFEEQFTNLMGPST